MTASDKTKDGGSSLRDTHRATDGAVVARPDRFAECYENGAHPNCHRCYRGEVPNMADDSGFWVEMGAVAGGANEHGLRGWIEMIEHHPDGREVRREYVATDSPLYPPPEASVSPGTERSGVNQSSPAPQGEDGWSELERLARAATGGEWIAGHFANDEHPCDCRYILSEGYCGSIATIDVDNGLSIDAGGNDSPPPEEAKANLRFIAAANPSTILKLIVAARSLPDSLATMEKVDG